MKREIYNVWEGLMVSKAAVPPAPGRRPPRCNSETVIGFDCEFTEWHGRKYLLSVQLAAEVAETLVSQMYLATAPMLTPMSMLAFVRAFLAVNGIAVKVVNGIKRVTLVAHFAAAEIGMFEDPVRDLAVRRVGRAHVAQTDVLTAPDGLWRITIIDLYGYFATSLKEIGASVGLPKLEIDVEDIENVMFDDPALFRAYSLRDAQIAYVAHTRFRQQILDEFRVDVLNHPSLAAVSGDIFRWNHFKSAPAPYVTEYEPTRRKKRNGDWTDGRRAVHVYSGSRDARIDFIRAMHGGRNEAFTVGFYEEPVCERDVTSMYPASAIQQALPDETTRMRAVTDLSAISVMEGAGSFEFRFPSGTTYPCLPVRQPGRDKLVFPAAGVSNATFSEVREALAMGAVVRILSAHGFEPSERERDHDVARFVRDIWGKKLAAEKGTLAYVIWKEVLNSLFGKFGQRTQSSNLVEVERLARQRGLGGAGALIALDPDLRDALHAAPVIGGLWSPERYALLVGRARASMSQFIRRSRAHLVSTDSIIADVSAPIDCEALDALRAVGSDLKLEKTADAALIVRSRMYALLRRAENMKPGEKFIAADDRWAVTKVARQGTGEPEESFARTLLACIRAGRDVAGPWTRTRLLGVEEAIRQGRRLGDAVTQHGVTRFRWDAKRRLLDRDCQIFRGSTTTAPYRSERRREGAARAVLVRTGQARRRVLPISSGKRERIAALLRAGGGIREVARQMKVAASTVSQINAEMRSSGGGSP